MKQNKEINKIKQEPWRSFVFVFVSYPWAWHLPWMEVDIPSDTPLEKTDFSQQTTIANSLLVLGPGVA